MIEAGDAATRRACEMMDKSTERDLERIRQAGGAVLRLSPAEISDLNARFADAGTEWARELDRRGKPGTEALQAFADAIKTARPGRP
jgi:hypothetical protein